MKHLLLLVAAGFCLATGAAADTEKKVDPRDASIWQEKPITDKQKQDPCKVLSSSVCPGYEDSKTDIQREQQRREDNRRYRETETGKWR